LFLKEIVNSYQMAPMYSLSTCQHVFFLHIHSLCFKAAGHADEKSWWRFQLNQKLVKVPTDPKLCEGSAIRFYQTCSLCDSSVIRSLFTARNYDALLIRIHSVWTYIALYLRFVQLVSVI
jgi:hypothetical protein